MVVGRALLGLLVALAVTLSGCVDPDMAGVGPGADTETGAEEEEHPVLQIPVRIREETVDGPRLGFDVDAILYIEGKDSKRLHEHPSGYVAQVPQNASFSFKLEGRFDHTTETYKGFVATPELAKAGLDLVVYKLRLEREWTTTLDTTVEPVVSRYAGGDTYWMPTAVRAHDDPAANRAYFDRVMGASIYMTWENSATDNADFGIGFGSSPDQVEFIWDEDIEPNMGSNGESLVVREDAIRSLPLADMEAFYIGPVSHEPVVVATGMDVHFQLILAIDEEFGFGPAPGWVVVGLALLGGLFAVHRRRIGR